MAACVLLGRFHLRINRGLAAILPAHFGIDFITFAVNILFPLLATKLDLNFTQVGIAAGLHIAANGLSQPLFGLLGDRIGSRRLLAGGIFVQG
ncbi:MAG: MFS transporter, partial [Chloroflexi bacterium]|nr:MFS transporter [Chloroflexota bacterium]